MLTARANITAASSKLGYSPKIVSEGTIQVLTICPKIVSEGTIGVLFHCMCVLILSMSMCLSISGKQKVF